MIKIATVIFASSVILVSAADASEISLRTSIIVEGKYLTLGDFFGISDEKASRRIAHSPKPGRSAIFDANWLYRVARANRVNWQPVSLNTRVFVERASQEIYREELEDVLISALRGKNVTGNIELAINGGLRKMRVATDQLATVGVENLAYDPRTGRFVASLAAPANDPSAQRLRITGRVHQLKAVPVMNKRLGRGKVITKNDIGWLNIRSSKIRKFMVLDEEDLVGMAAKRTIRESTPVGYSHVRRPVLVTKGALVTINLTTPMMTLTAQGKAPQEGSMGDTIPIINIQSKQTIEAKVTGINQVTVALLQHMARN